MTKRWNSRLHWSVFAAAALSLGSVAATPQAESLAELVGIWLIPLLFGLYGVHRMIKIDAET
jgi:hypothetical protein